MTFQLTFADTLVRLLLAALCGGIIGIERGQKHRPAGFRTYMIVCMGAALTMILSAYMTELISTVWDPFYIDLTKTDVSRLGAQVINGIGFLGAGTIIVTGRQQVKGLTTAAGLWASACMGLSIGAGFYAAAIICFAFILLTMIVFSFIERIIRSRSRNMDLYVEFEDTDNMTEMIATLKNAGVRIFDVELTKGKYSDNRYPNAIFTLEIPKGTTHTMIFSLVAELETVRSIEEL
ncbi:MAG: MgtC/SapB family protein [Ruminococcaceae bacterium]|nr:MgtC/SapB family protein [Oscillospiraceae bacterium]